MQLYVLSVASEAGSEDVLLSSQACTLRKALTR